MEFFAQLHQIEWWALFIDILIILLSVQWILTLIDWFKERLGLETKYSKSKKNINKKISETQEELEKLSKHHEHDFNTMKSIIEDINDNIKEMRAEKIEEQLTEKRWKIINFATDLSTGKQFFQESYKYIIGVHEDYQALLKKNNKTNGLIEANMEYIMEEYSKALKNGFFIKDK